MPARSDDRRAMALAGACVVLGALVLAAAILSLRSAPRPPRRSRPPPLPGAAALPAAPGRPVRREERREAREAGLTAAGWAASSPATAGARPEAVGRELLPPVRARPGRLRRDVAAARVGPPPGDRLLHLPRHVPRPELRPLLRRPDAVQRHQRPADDLGALPARVPAGRAALRLPEPHGAPSVGVRRLRTRSWPRESLLRIGGAGPRLDAAAVAARAYDYYGHDLHGRRVTPTTCRRAIGWSQRGSRSTPGSTRPSAPAVDAAWGAPVRAALSPRPRRHREARTSLW